MGQTTGRDIVEKAGGTQEIEKTTPRMRLFFAQGELGDAAAYQSFTILVFIFYYAVLGLEIGWVTTGFILWSIWNAFDDLLLGYFSDKTRSKRGRRLPWMIGGIIPLCIVVILLYTPPLDTKLTSFIYFLIILFVFDFCYTAFNLNYNSQFSEMFVTVKERSDAGRLRGVFVVLGLVVAFILPGIIIGDLTPPKDATPEQLSALIGSYQITGIVCATICFISLFLVVKYGSRDTREFSKDAETAPSIGQALKFTFKNKIFVIFMVAGLATWSVNGLLPSMIPLFTKHVLNDPEGYVLILLICFIVAAVSMPIWTLYRKKYGARSTGIIASIVWAGTLLLLAFSPDFSIAIIISIFVGFGLGGSIYFYDQCLAEIIDADEVQYGTRRAGGYYGIISFVIRLGWVIDMLVIGMVFTGANWATYIPNPGVDVILGLQFLVGIFPAILLGIGALAMYFYPLHGERLKQVREQLTALHDKKWKDSEQR